MKQKSNVVLGVTVSHEKALQSRKDIIDIACQEVNQYCHHFNIPFSFDYYLLNNDNNVETALLNTEKFHEKGIDIILGHDYSSHCNASLSYVNKNNMLLFSSGSTSPLLSIPEDNLFRITPNDFQQVPAIIKTIENFGINLIILIQRSDAWADGISNYFQSSWNKIDKMMFEKIRYRENDIESYISQIEEVIIQYKNSYNIGVLYIGFSEIVDLLNKISDNSPILDIPWFGTDGTTLLNLDNKIANKIANKMAKIKLLSPLASPPESIKFAKKYDEYYSLSKEPLGYYNAGYYDIFWLISISIISISNYNINTLKKNIQYLSEFYYGLTGLCTLNNDGDRTSSSYQIWGYDSINSKITSYIFGTYNDINQLIYWQTPISTLYYRPTIKQPPPLGLLSQTIEHNYTIDAGQLTSYAYALKYFNSNFENKFKIPCFQPHIDDWVSFPKLYQSCSDESDFVEKMNILAGIIDRINTTGIKRKISDKSINSSLNLIETLFNENHISYNKKAFNYIRNVRQLRSYMHPTHTTSSELRKQLKKIDIHEYPFEWEKEFKNIIIKCTDNLNILTNDLKKIG